MKYLKERVAYLKGLADGMQLNESSNEGKLLKAIIEVMDDMALAIDDIEEVQEELSELVDNIDEDLGEVESAIFGDDEDESEDDDDDDSLGEFECPHCNAKIEIKEDMFSDEGNTIKCPACGEDIEIEWECDCEDCEDKE